MRTLLIMFVLSIPLAFGQLDSNSITVTASRSTTTGVQPDQAVFTAQVSSGLDASLDDVLAVLQGTGITTVNFVTMNSFVAFPETSAQPGQLLGWTFRYAVPLAKIKDTITLLTSLQQTIANRHNGLALTFGLQGFQASGQNYSLSDLITDARTQAQKLADAGGVGVGNILAISSPTGTSTQNVIQAAAPGAPGSPPSGPPACAVTVKFGLLRF
jgi:hypothetical protein